MCGRYTYDDTENLERRFAVKVTRKVGSNFNAAPTQSMPVIRDSEHGGGRVLDMMKWGIIPPYSKDGKPLFSTFNARAETIFEKNTYRGPILRRRCLAIASGFYEWKRDGSTKKQPYYITVKDRKTIAFAAIWEIWKDKTSGDETHSYSIITTTPNEEMSALHDRMPVILHEEDEEAWLSDEQDEEFIRGFLRPYEDGALAMHEVSTDVNVVRNNDGYLVRPLDSK